MASAGGRAPAQTLWVGTYPADGAAPGSGEGIWRVTLDPYTGALSDALQVAVTHAPSFLAWGPRGLLYATNEDVAGGLSVWRPTPGSLDLVGKASTGGAGPCHVWVDDAAGTALVANYSAGSLAVVRLAADGLPAAGAPHQVFAFEGSGPHPARQAGPHSHFVLPAGEHVLVTDLGADVVRRFGRDPDGRLVEDGIAVRLPAGAGPRHAAFSADGAWLYVVGELDGLLHTIAWDAPSASGRVVASCRVDPAASEGAKPAHLVLAGDTLTVGVRGTDSIVSHRVGADGLPVFAGRVALPGSLPRHHAVVGGWLVVAQQRRGGVVAMTPDGVVTGEAGIGSAACILPA